MSDTATDRLPVSLPRQPAPQPDESADNPFIGPIAFERGGDARFVGRARETKEVVSYVFSQPVVLVYSPSGAGKSSLINAGVIPELEDEHGFQVLPVARVRGRWDLEAADRATCFYTYQAIVGMDPAIPPDEARHMTLAQFLDRWPRPLDDDDEPCPRVVVFDQFEEILAVYSNSSYDKQRTFFQQVAEALRRDPRLRIVWLVREDRVSQLEPFARLLPSGLGLRYHLEHLTAAAALDAVLRTTEGSSRWFSPEAAHELVGQLLKTRAETRPGHFELIDGTRVEPVQLQVVCRSVWDRAAPGEICPSDLVRFGDIGDVLADYYDAAVAGTVLATGFDEGTLRDWFSQRLITEMHTRGTVFRGPELTDEVIPVPNAVVDDLEERHIIRGERRAEGGGQWFELVHDTFIDPILAANAKWHRRAGPPWLGVARTAGPLVVVALVLLIGALALRQGSAYESFLAEPQFEGVLTPSAPTAEHVLRSSGGGAVGVAVSPVDGAVDGLVLRGPDGEETAGRDLDRGPVLSALFEGVAAGEHTLVTRGRPDVETTYQVWLAQGPVLTPDEDAVEDVLPVAGERTYLLVGTGQEQTVRLGSPDFDTAVTVTALDASEEFFNDDATAGYESSATDSGFLPPAPPDAPALGSTDSALSFPSRPGQLYTVRVASYDAQGGGEYTLTAQEPRPPVVLGREAQHSGSLPPLTSVALQLDPASTRMGLSSPDGGALGVEIVSGTGEVLVDERVSALDRAGLQLDLPRAPQRLLTITNQGSSVAAYRLVVGGAGGPP